MARRAMSMNRIFAHSRSEIPMKLKLLLIAAGFAILASLSLQAQYRHCATTDVWQQRAAQDPRYLERRNQSEAATQAWIATQPQANKTTVVVTIPVVVHVVYKNSTENISDAQVQSQIRVMNEDFRLRNADSLANNHPFWGATADAEIDFCLASIDPSGNATTGITRTSTTHNTFQNLNIDDIKFTNAGGRDNWDPTHYLNIWVCDLGNQLYGYATFPSDLAVDPNYDGVVINYTAFGTMGTAVSPSDLGRTATHEIGHWLNLSHIWGDQTCGDDMIADTEPAQDANYGCFTFPYNANNSCGSGANGEMYMNYMDYTDDNCMAMFTLGQKNRMRAAINGDRSEILNSGGCLVTGTQAQAADAAVAVYPNPSTGTFVVNANYSSKASISVFNSLGREVLLVDRVPAFPHTIDLSAQPSDIYMLKVIDGRHMHTQKIIVTR
jgi:Pregnancy-associated plasma protein-A/Secretion system C-terminal sorting domain